MESTDLIVEMERYLAVVEVFRAEGCDLQWCSDPTATAAREPTEPAACPSPPTWLERG